MSTARQKIFRYIQKNRAVSAAEIARDLAMTSANARHHLKQLEKEGRIEALGRRAAGKKGGRPAKLYGISRIILGDGLPALSHHLLEEMLAAANARQREGLLQKLGQRLANADRTPKSPDFGRSSSPMIRLAETVKHLNRLGYHARWEAHARGPRLILNHCPYAAIIEAHPELCEMDAALLEECMKPDRSSRPVRFVTQLAKLEGAEGGRPYCVFAMR